MFLVFGGEFGFFFFINLFIGGVFSVVFIVFIIVVNLLFFGKMKFKS